MVSPLAPTILRADESNTAEDAIDEQSDDEQPALGAGLIATYTSLVDANSAVTRVDAKPSFYITEGSPHPRMPAGPFQVVWRGEIVWRESAPVSFFAFVRGQLTIAIDDQVVLTGEG